MNDKLQWSGRGAARHGGARSPDLVLVTLRMMERKPSFENYCLGFLQAFMVWLTVLCWEPETEFDSEEFHCLGDASRDPTSFLRQLDLALGCAAV